MSGLKSFGNARSVSIRGGVTTSEAGLVSLLSPSLSPGATSPLAIEAASVAYSLVDPDALTPVFARVPGLSYQPVGQRDARGTLYTMQPLGQTAFAVPAAATQASAALGANLGYAWVCTSIGAQLIIPAGVNQPIITLTLRQSGGGGNYWQRSFGVGAAVTDAMVQSIDISGLAIRGAIDVGMELQFSAAGVATTVQSVSFSAFLTS